MRVGLIGSGQIARIHGPIILKQSETQLIAIADTDVARAKATAAVLNVEKVYQDVTEMLAQERLDVVHILTPPQSHASMAIMAMNHGCHVLVEKPMAVTVADVERMIETAQQNRMRLCVNHNMLYDRVIRRALDLTRNGVIGNLVSVEVCYLFDGRRYPAILEDGAEYYHWSYSLNGGPLQDQMPHPASLVLELMPDVGEIHWTGQNRGVLPKDWHDEIRVLLTSDTVLGYISISFSERPDTLSVTLKGTGGTIHADAFTNTLILQKRSHLPRALSRGIAGFTMAWQYARSSLENCYRYSRGHIDASGGISPLITAFYECIRTGGELPVSPDKSRKVVDLISRIWPTPCRGITGHDAISFHHSRRNDRPIAFVTGASGFIGIHLVRKLLSQKMEVRALVRPNSIHAGRLRKLDVDIVEADLTDTDALFKASQGVHSIFHAAMAASNRWEVHAETTVKATQTLIDSALVHQVERFVYLSSLGVYDLGHVKKNTLITEDHPCQRNPKRMGVVTLAKIEAEKMLLQTSQKGQLGVTIVRPGIVIGPFGPVLFPHLGYHYRHRLFLVIGSGNTVLPLTYVENTVDAIYRAAMSDKARGQIYNLIDDGEITVLTYLEHFIRITGVDARTICLPTILPYLGVTAYESMAFLHLIRQGVASRSQLQWKRALVRFDNTRAKEDLGWEPEVPMADALSRTFQAYAARHASQ